MKKNFVFSLSKAQVEEHLYENLISNCNLFFDVKFSSEIMFHFELEDNIFIAIVYRDGFDTSKIPPQNNLAFTENQYQTLYFPDSDNDYHIIIENGMSGLSMYEVRYIKWSWPKIFAESCKLLYHMVNNCLNIKKHIATVDYSQEKEMFFYRGSCSHKSKKLKQGNVNDISSEMTKNWYYRK